MQTPFYSKKFLEIDSQMQGMQQEAHNKASASSNPAAAGVAAEAVGLDAGTSEVVRMQIAFLFCRRS